jgi:hypothetical protein
MHYESPVQISLWSTLLASPVVCPTSTNIIDYRSLKQGDCGDGSFYISDESMNAFTYHVGVCYGKVDRLVNIEGKLHAALYGIGAPGWGREVQLWPVTPIEEWDGEVLRWPKTKVQDNGSGPAHRAITFEGQVYVIGDCLGARMHDEHRALRMRFRQAGGGDDSQTSITRGLSNADLKMQIAQLEAQQGEPKALPQAA